MRMRSPIAAACLLAAVGVAPFSPTLEVDEDEEEPGEEPDAPADDDEEDEAEFLDDEEDEDDLLDDDDDADEDFDDDDDDEL